MASLKLYAHNLSHIYEWGVHMPKKQGSHNKTGYILTAKERHKPIWVSRGDHLAIEWWAKQQNITLTEALHHMIIEFMTKRLEAFRQKR